MRGFTLRAVPVCFAVVACGCFLTQKAPAPATGEPPTVTHAYWRQVGATFAQKPVGNDLPAMVRLVRSQTEALRALPTEGVDAELVAAVEQVIKCEDEVLRRADMVNNDPGALRRNEQMARVFADANRAAADAKKRVRALQPALDAGYGGGFAPMGG